MADRPRQNRTMKKDEIRLWHLALAPVLTFWLSVAVAVSVRAEETVQLSSFLVHAQNEDGTKTGTQPITLMIDVQDKKRADYVCAMAPRVRDAIVRHLSTQHFILTKNGTLLIDGIDARLRPIIVEALQWDMLDAVHVFHGSRKVSSKLAVRLNQTGCVRIADDGRPKAADKSEH